MLLLHVRTTVYTYLWYPNFVPVNHGLKISVSFALLFRVVVITSGITSFVLAKRHIDRLRMEKIRREAKLKIEKGT